MEDGESSGDFFNCGVCRRVASNAVECTTCWNIFCESCLNNLPDNVCPRCMTQPRNTRPAEFARQLISDIKGDCPFQCGVRMRPREFKCHMKHCPNAPNVQHGEVMNLELTNQALDPEVLIYHLSCQVCLMLASEPVHCLTCHKVFCTTCFTEMPLKLCPGCSARADHYYPAHLARRMIGEIKVLCPNNGCDRETTLPQLVDHLRSCQFSIVNFTGCSDVTDGLHSRSRRNPEFDKRKTPEMGCAQPQQGQDNNSTWKKVAIGLAVATGVVIVVVVGVRVGPRVIASPAVRSAAAKVAQATLSTGRAIGNAAVNAGNAIGNFAANAGETLGSNAMYIFNGVNVIEKSRSVLAYFSDQWKERQGKDKSGSTAQDKADGVNCTANGDKGGGNITASTVKNYCDNTITFSLVTHIHTKDK